MGLFDHLFKAKSPTGEEKVGEPAVEGSSASKPAEGAPRSTPPQRADPSAFLHPKNFVPRGAPGLTPAPRPGGKGPERRPGTGAPSGGGEEIVLTLGDVLSRIPTHYLKQGTHDAKRELRFRINDLSSDIARGRAAVPLSRIAQLVPDIFVKEISRDEDTEVRLPLQKLVEQIGLLRSRPKSPAAEKTARPATSIELPPARPVMPVEARVEFPAVPPAPAPVLEPPPPAPIPAHTPPIILADPTTAPKPVELRPAAEQTAPAPVILGPPPVTEMPVAPPASVSTPAPVMAEAPAPVAIPAFVPPPSPVVEPEPIAPAATVAEPVAPVAPLAAPPIPAAEPRPTPQPTVVAPELAAKLQKIVINWEGDIASPPEAKPEAAEEAVVHDIEAEPVRIEPAADNQKLAPLESPELEPGEEKIQLNLAAILRHCPSEIIAGELPHVEDSVRITLPFAPIDRQLVKGYVEVSALRFIAALPEVYQKHFVPKVGVKVPIPLEEVFQNLPSPAHELTPAAAAPPPVVLAPASLAAEVSPTRWMPIEQAPALEVLPVEAKAVEAPLPLPPLPANESPAPAPAAEPATPAFVPPPAFFAAPPPAPLVPPIPLATENEPAVAETPVVPETISTEAAASAPGHVPPWLSVPAAPAATHEAPQAAVPPVPEILPAEIPAPAAEAIPPPLPIAPGAANAAPPADEPPRLVLQPPVFRPHFVPPPPIFGFTPPPVTPAPEPEPVVKPEPPSVLAALTEKESSPVAEAPPAGIPAVEAPAAETAVVPAVVEPMATEATPTLGKVAVEPLDSEPSAELIASASEHDAPDLVQFSSEPVPFADLTEVLAHETTYAPDLAEVVHVDLPEPESKPAAVVTEAPAGAEAEEHRPVPIVEGLAVTAVAETIGDHAPLNFHDLLGSAEPAKEPEALVETPEAPAAEALEPLGEVAPTPEASALEAVVPPLPEEQGGIAPPDAVTEEEEALIAPAPESPTAVVPPLPLIPPAVPIPLPKLAAEPPEHLEIIPPSAAVPHRRFDQDAIQALFMTEETLDLPKISRLAAGLPGVYACVIATRDQACTGGTLPEGFDLAALLGLAPRVGEAAGRMPIGQLKHFTLYGDAYSVSFFERNGLSVCAVHRPRSFVPGVREKLVALADELSR